MPSGIYNVQPRSMTQSIKDWAEIDDAKQRRQINALALQDRERGLAENMAIQNAMAGLATDATPEQAAAVLRRVGPGGWAKADVIEKNAAERQKAAAYAREQEIKAKELETKKAVEDIKVFNYYMNAVSSDPRPEVLDAAVSEIEKRTGQPFPLGGLLKKHAADPQMLAKTAHAWALEAEKRLPKTSQVNLGGSEGFYATDPITGTVIPKGETPKTATPGEVLSDERQREETAEKARHNRAMEGGAGSASTPVTVTEVVDPNDPEKLIKIDARTGRKLGDAGKQPVVGVNLSQKDIQKREAAYPKATTAVKSFNNTADELIRDLRKLKDHKGLDSITGIAAGRLPGITAEGREAQAIYDKIVARGGFNELSDMRQASPTGGALGNVSDKEGQQLRSAFAAIDRRQDAGSVKNAIDEAISKIEASKSNISDAYELTYEYRADKKEKPKTRPPLDSFNR